MTSLKFPYKNGTLMNKVSPTLAYNNETIYHKNIYLIRIVINKKIPNKVTNKQINLPSNINIDRRDCSRY